MVSRTPGRCALPLLTGLLTWAGRASTRLPPSSAWPRARGRPWSWTGGSPRAGGRRHCGQSPWCGPPPARPSSGALRGVPGAAPGLRGPVAGRGDGGSGGPAPGRPGRPGPAGGGALTGALDAARLARGGSPGPGTVPRAALARLLPCKTWRPGSVVGSWCWCWGGDGDGGLAGGGLAGRGAGGRLHGHRDGLAGAALTSCCRQPAAPPG